MSDLYALRQLLGDHYQNFQDDYPEPWAVVDEYLSQVDPDTIKRVMSQMDRILARHLTEDALRSIIVSDFHCDYWVEAAGWTWRGWLAEIRRRAEESLRTAEPGHAGMTPLFAVYYRDGWQTRYGSDVWTVFDLYLSSKPTDDVELLLRQLDETLTQSPTEDALESLVHTELRCKYSPGADGSTYRDWLVEIRSRGQAEVDRRARLKPVPDAAALTADASTLELLGRSAGADAATHPIRGTSTWASEAAAERTVGWALANSNEDISRWLASGQRRTLVLHMSGASVTGRHQEHNEATDQDVRGAMVILRRSWTYSYGRHRNLGYEVQSAYPSPIAHAGEVRFPELQQFLGGCFNQDWPYIDGPNCWDGLARYLADTSKSEIAAAADQIEHVLALDLSEAALALLLAVELWCYYSAEADGWTYRGWLSEVGRRLRATLRDAVPGLFELGQLVGGYFGEDWATRFGPNDALDAYLNGAPVQSLGPVVAQIDHVLSQELTEQDLRSLVRTDLGSRYDPASTAESHRDWLARLRQQAHNFLVRASPLAKAPVELLHPATGGVMSGQMTASISFTAYATFTSEQAI